MNANNREGLLSKNRDAYFDYEVLTKLFLDDIDTYPEWIETPYKQKLQIISKRKWTKELRIFNPCYSDRKLSIPIRIHEHPVIEYSVRHFLIFRLETKSSFDGIDELLLAISKIDAEPTLTKETEFTKQVADWIGNTYTEIKAQNSNIRPALKDYILYCVEGYLWGYKEDLLVLLLDEDSKVAPKAINLWVKTLDSTVGPFTQQEMRCISETINTSENLNSYSRALLLICRDTGLRPIQIALLRTEDFRRNYIGPYLSVPYVKGGASKMRRAGINFTEVYIQEETAHMIEQLIYDNERSYKILENHFSIFCIEHHIEYEPLPRALFPRRQTYAENIDFLRHPELSSYFGHQNSGRISSEIIMAGKNLAIKSLTNDGDVYITAYRFRRTVATNMVLQGYNAEEVAHALTHRSTSSTKHYFGWNRDIIDFVNFTTSSSKDLMNSVEAWKGRLIDENKLLDKNQSVIRLNNIHKLGVCNNQDICNYHPTVSCYGCHSFSPYTNGSHEKALEEIRELHQYYSEHSTVQIKEQTQVAVENAEMIIKAQNYNE